MRWLVADPAKQKLGVLRHGSDVASSLQAGSADSHIPLLGLPRLDGHVG